MGGRNRPLLTVREVPQVSYWSRSFPGLAECLAEVRQFTQMVLGNRPGTDLVVLAVSELAGNAIVHTASGEPGGQFVVHLAAFADRWQVRVDDEGSPTDPRIVVADTGEGGETDWGAEAGRGLAMVNAVSRKWGVLGDHYARAVWAEIPYPEQNGTAVRSVMSMALGFCVGSSVKVCSRSRNPSVPTIRILSSVMM